MYCYRQIQDDLYWVGANNRRLAMFEGVYDVPKGVSYNAYLLLDEKTVLFDTVDASVSERLFENLDALLGDRALDYVLVQHMEPDHSATLYQVIQRYPNVQVVCNAATKKMIEQFFPCAIDDRWVETADGGSFCSGRHSFAFVKAPMVHWPEVQVTFDTTTGTLFSADAFGVFGAINGAIFADEVDFERDYMDEARRYYCNIVGKYGMQVQTLLKKAAALDIKMVCPLHGFVWRENIGSIVDKYLHWSSYTPEEQAVVIAYGSIYGGTENAAEILSVMLREKGIKTVMFDVSMTPASEIVAAAFRYSHLVFASATYNNGIFIKMEDLLNDLVAHAIQNRTVALMENGTWAPTAAGHMAKKLEGCKDIRVLEGTVTIRSSVKQEQRDQIAAMADAIAATM